MKQLIDSSFKMNANNKHDGMEMFAPLLRLELSQ